MMIMLSKNKIYQYLILTVLFTHSPINAQQNSIYTQYYLHNQLVNPAIAGSEFNQALIGSVSKQWMGITNAPTSVLLSGSLLLGTFEFYDPKMYVNKTRLTSRDRVGLGFVFFNENEGPVLKSGGILSYAYHIPLRHSNLSLGLSTGFYNSLIDETDFQPVTANDPIIHYGKESYNRFNANAGTYYYSKHIFGGISVTDLIPLQNKLSPTDKIRKDYHLLAGYLIKAGKKIHIEPAVYVGLYDYNQLQYQISTKIYYNYVHWLSLYYHSLGVIGIKACIQINKLHVSYGFSIAATRIALFNLGTHEISLGTNTGLKRMQGY